MSEFELLLKEGVNYLTSGNYSLAIEKFNQALQRDPNFAELYILRGSAKYKLGNIQAAIADYTQALQLNPNSAEAYFCRASILDELGNIQAAIADYTQALQIKPNWEKAYHERAAAFTEIGHHQGAVEDYTQLLRINPYLVTTYVQRAVACLMLGNHQAAIDDCTKALRIQPNFAEAYVNRGYALLQIGDDEGAIADYHKAADLYLQNGKIDEYHHQQAVLEEIRQRHPDSTTGHSPHIAQISINPVQAKADTLLRQGIEQSNEECYQQALNLYREIKDSWGESLAIYFLNNLAKAYHSQANKQYGNGQYETAFYLYEKALKLYQESHNESKVAVVIHDLGILYGSLHRFKDAAKYYQDSLEIVQKIGDTYGELRLYGSMGTNYLQQAEEQDYLYEGYEHLDTFKKSLHCYDKMLEIAKHTQDVQGQLLALDQIGNCYSLQEDYNRAIEFYQQGLNLAETNNYRLEKAFILHGLGDIYWKKESYNQAIKLDLESLEIFQEFPDRESVRELCLKNIGRCFFELGNLVEAEKYLREAIEVVESKWERAGKLDANKISMFDDGGLSYPLLQEVLVAQNKVEVALEFAERGRARAIAEALARRLSPNQNSQINFTHPTIEQIKNIAKEQKATLVEYTVSDNAVILIWVIKPTGEIHFRRVDPTSFPDRNPRSLRKLVFVARWSIGALRLAEPVPTDALDPTETNFSNTLEKLYSILIYPIADFLPKDPNERVIFIPHSILSLVPFAALVVASGKYLIEQHTIGFATSIQMLELTRKHQERVQVLALKDMLVVGNPTMPSPKFGQTFQLSPLPGAETEALEVAELFATKALIGNEATKDAIFKRMPSSRIIHLATHGLLDDLSGVNIPGAIALAPSQTDNGWLTAAEILNLELNAELAVMSACNTGQGRLTADGVIGLSRSFIASGIPSTIVSLWAVSDDSTAFLMKEFYQNLQRGLDKAQALRQAMLTTMKMEKYSNPLKWAAFMLIGEADSAISSD